MEDRGDNHSVLFVKNEVAELCGFKPLDTKRMLNKFVAKIKSDVLDKLETVRAFHDL